MVRGHAPRSARVEAAVRAAAAARAPNLGSPARVPSSDLPPAPGSARGHAPRSVLVEAASRAVAVAQASRVDNEAEAGGSRLALVLNLRAPAETAQRVGTRAAVPRGQTALAAPGAAIVVEGAGVVQVPEVGEVVAVHVVAVAGVKAKVLDGDSLLQGV